MYILDIFSRVTRFLIYFYIIFVCKCLWLFTIISDIFSLESLIKSSSDELLSLSENFGNIADSKI
jgi:hypothetical protein